MNLDLRYTDKDYEKMLFNVMEVGVDEDLFTEIEEFKKFRPYITKANMDVNTETEIDPEQYLDPSTTMRFIALFYDPNSPFVKDFEDYVERKKYCALYAGFEVDEDGNFTHRVDQMLRCFIGSINSLIVRFCMQFHNPVYTQLVIKYEQYVFTAEAILQRDIKSEKKNVLEIESTRSKLGESLNKILEEIKELSTEILNDDNTYLRKDLFCTIDEKLRNKLYITPESIAYKKDEAVGA